jgi:hypothetical protein
VRGHEEADEGSMALGGLPGLGPGRHSGYHRWTVAVGGRDGAKGDSDAPRDHGCGLRGQGSLVRELGAGRHPWAQGGCGRHGAGFRR